MIGWSGSVNPSSQKEHYSAQFCEKNANYDHGHFVKIFSHFAAKSESARVNSARAHRREGYLPHLGKFLENFSLSD